MADEERELTKVLRDLAATCRDAEEGYNKAAKGARSDEMRAKFDAYSVERKQCAAELDRLLTQYGAEPGQTGHGSAPLRRGWVELEQRIRPRDDAELASFAADGDESGLKHFERALELETLPTDARSVVEKQARAIRQAVESLRRVTV